MKRLLLLLSAVLTLLALSPSGTPAHAAGSAGLDAVAHLAAGHDHHGRSDGAGAHAAEPAGCAFIPGHCTGVILPASAEAGRLAAPLRLARPVEPGGARAGPWPETETPPPRG